MGDQVPGGKRAPSCGIPRSPGPILGCAGLSRGVHAEYRILRLEEARLPTALPTAASPSPTTLDQVAP
jgi:hypothetical protein